MHTEQVKGEFPALVAGVAWAKWEESEEIPDIMNGMCKGKEVGETMYSQGARTLEVTKGKHRQEVDGIWRAITPHVEPGLHSETDEEKLEGFKHSVAWNADCGKRQLHNLVIFPTSLKPFTLK